MASLIQLLPRPTKTQVGLRPLDPGRRIALGRLLFALLVLAGAGRLFAGEVEVQEPAIKAAGLFKIISFVEWPAEAFAAPDAPLVVGVLGHGPIADLLPAFSDNETWNGRRVLVRRMSSAAAALDCHVLFVGESQHAEWTFIRPQLARRPILTVSDANQFARNGGVVQLATARNRLHLVINLSAARAAGITISSKVLRLAEVIGDSRP